MTAFLPPLAVAVVALFLVLLAVHEFRLGRRVKQASARLEHGKARPGYLYSPGRKLP